jgi:predicted Co/Zn/Cd cation transporter (cation efflux family)
MNTKKFSLLGVVFGLIAGAMIALFAGSWMFWLVLGVVLGVLLSKASAGSKSGQRPSLGQGARA